MNSPRFCSLLLGISAFFAPAFPALASENSPHLQVIQSTPPRFPPALIAQGITSGEAWVVLSVDAGGRLTDALVSRYTHPAFAAEALRLLPHWTFKPAIVDGEPVGVTTELRLRFEATGALVSLDAIRTVEELSRRLSGPTYHKNLYNAADLDTAPTALQRVSPAHPGRLPSQPTGDYSAVVDFVIDDTGRPRMPALVSATHPEFGNRAVAALLQWRFTPPLRQGKPVAARVRQEFVFPNS